MPMKKILCLAITVLTGINAFAQIEFKQEYALYDSLANRTRLVHHGAVTPLWVDSVNFSYETREAEEVVY